MLTTDPSQWQTILHAIAKGVQI